MDFFYTYFCIGEGIYYIVDCRMRMNVAASHYRIKVRNMAVWMENDDQFSERDKGNVAKTLRK